MSDQQYHNETSQAERKQALKNDQAQHSTLFERAKGEVGQELGGRFAHLARGQQHIVGTQGPTYPRINSGPWARPCPTGISPPLGYSVDAMPPEEGFNPPEADYSASIGVGTPTSDDGKVE
jgi:hypothetical protein